MTEPIPSPPERPPFRHRFLLAMVLGHLAGAYAFCVTTILFAALSDLWTEGPAAIAPSGWSRLLEGVLAFPVVTAIIGLWAAFLMIPSTLLAAPAAFLAARWLRTGVPATMALGALVGLGPALIVFRDAPRLDPRPFGSAAAAGAVFAWVIWMLCIAPRRARTGGG